MAAAAAAGASPLAGSPLAGPLQFAAGDGAAMAQRTAAVKDRSSRRDLQAAAFGAVPRTGSHGHLAGLARRSVGPGDVAGEEAEAARRKERAEAAATAAQEHRDEKLAAARNKRLASSEDAEVGSTCGCRPAGCVQGCSSAKCRQHAVAGEQGQLLPTVSPCLTALAQLHLQLHFQLTFRCSPFPAVFAGGADRCAGQHPAPALLPAHHDRGARGPGGAGGPGRRPLGAHAQHHRRDAGGSERWGPVCRHWGPVCRNWGLFVCSSWV